MAVKVYELQRGMDAGIIYTTYCGVSVKVEFKNGNHLNGIHASVSTNSKFVQDAIEQDHRYGTLFKLARVIDNTPTATEEEPAKVEKSTTQKSKRRTQAEIDAAKGKKATTDGTTAVEEVKSINDAIEYFSKKGESVDSDTKIEELKEKYNVSFPNLKQ